MFEMKLTIDVSPQLQALLTQFVPNTSLASFGAPEPQPTPPAQPIPTQQITTPLQPAPVPTAPPIPTTTISYELQDLSTAASSLMDQGRMAELQEILTTFGVAAMTELPKERYGEFAAKLREKGVTI